jgi:cytochrome P450
MELQTVLPEVFRRLPDLRITPGRHLTFKETSAAYGLSHMPVTLVTGMPPTTRRRAPACM